MLCYVLYYIILYYIILHYITLHYITLHYINYAIVTTIIIIAFIANFPTLHNCCINTSTTPGVNVPILLYFLI